MNLNETSYGGQRPPSIEERLALIESKTANIITALQELALAVSRQNESIGTLMELPSHVGEVLNTIIKSQAEVNHVINLRGDMLGESVQGLQEQIDELHMRELADEDYAGSYVMETESGDQYAVMIPCSPEHMDDESYEMCFMYLAGIVEDAESLGLISEDMAEAIEAGIRGDLTEEQAKEFFPPVEALPIVGEVSHIWNGGTSGAVYVTSEDAASAIPQVIAAILIMATTQHTITGLVDAVLAE